MTPGSFDIVTAREYIGDATARKVEEKARADAEAGTSNPPRYGFDTYGGQILEHMAGVVYAAQFEKRRARLERMKR